MHQIDLIELEPAGVQSILPRQPLPLLNRRLSPLLNRRLVPQQLKNEALVVCRP